MGDLVVELFDDEIVVSLPGTHYSVTYFKIEGDPQLYAKNWPVQVDPRAEMAQAEFLAKAWQLANGMARQLGWIT
jgi:hypothetical protein